MEIECLNNPIGCVGVGGRLSDLIKKMSMAFIAYLILQPGACKQSCPMLNGYLHQALC